MERTKKALSYFEIILKNLKSEVVIGILKVKNYYLKEGRFSNKS